MLQKPDWPLGLDLGPQHLQFQDSYHEQLISSRFQAVCDDAFGAVLLDLDERALHASGDVHLDRFEGILPDGTLVACGTKDAPGTLMRTAPRFEGSLLVYLALPAAQDGAANVDDAGDPQALQRYSKEEASIADFARGGEPFRIPWLRPNLRLLFEGERLDNFTVLPIARLVRTPDGDLSFEDDFVPQFLSLRASSHLEGKLRELLRALAERQSALERALAPAASDEPRQGTLFKQALAIAEAVVNVDDLIDPTHARPRAIYRVLAPLLATLSVFTPTWATPPKYNFQDLSTTFAKLFEGLDGVLAYLSASLHRRIPLNDYDEETKYAELTEAAIFRHEFFLVARGDDIERLRQDVPELVKLAAWHELRGVQHAAAAGITLEPLAHMPAALPPLDAAVCFRLDKAGPHYDALTKTGQLGIFCPPQLAIAELRFYAVPPAVLWQSDDAT